jgi:hypothetical protein
MRSAPRRLGRTIEFLPPSPWCQINCRGSRPRRRPRIRGPLQKTEISENQFAAG